MLHGKKHLEEYSDDILLFMCCKLWYAAVVLYFTSLYKCIFFQDLLALLKNVENEIKLCEVNLKDELEKRRKYQVN